MDTASQSPAQNTLTLSDDRGFVQIGRKAHIAYLDHNGQPCETLCGRRREMARTWIPYRPDERTCPRADICRYCRVRREGHV